MMNSLKENYNNKIKAKLKKDLNLDSVMELPRLKKIVVNAGIGEFNESKEAVESFVTELAAITGQKPSPRKARLSESGFKIRKGDVVGYTVTLRGERMWAFLEKLINIVLPRVRDFKGVNPKSFDSHGNFSVGLREHVIFPEVDANNVKGIRGLQITMNILAKEKEHSKVFLEELGVPFKK